MSDLFGPIEVDGYPGFTIRRYDEMKDGKWMWELFYNGVKVAVIERRVSFEEAKHEARKCIQKLPKE